MSTKAFEDVIELSLRQFAPDEAKKQHIAIARAGLADYLAAAGSAPDVLIETDGHTSSTEDSVKPFGVIAYRFTYMSEIVIYAMTLARELSPVDSGKFKNSWFAMINFAHVDVMNIPAGATVMITNTQPYLRKIHQGSKGFEKYVPPGIVEKVRQQVLRVYRKNVEVGIQFVTLQNGYVLQGHAPTVAAKANSRSSAFRAGRSHLQRRQDTRKGQLMTYPTLVLEPKIYL